MLGALLLLASTAAAPAPAVPQGEAAETVRRVPAAEARQLQLPAAQALQLFKTLLDESAP